VVEQTPLLIVGAGPYGLSTAAYARQQGVDFLMVGEPMGFWKHHMPAGMLLRSPVSWHLDPLGSCTFEHYVACLGLKSDDVHPIPVELFLDYAQWFQQENRLQPWAALVQRLECRNGMFDATLEDGRSIVAQNVVVAPGVQYFQHISEDIVASLPTERYSHTCCLTEFSLLKGKRCLIIGGRQSAFEWAALLSEQADAEVHVVHRHETPRFAPSDWSWVNAMIDATAQRPGWFRRLPAAEREAIQRRFWAEGRLKLEPWLEPRVRAGKVHLWPHSRVVSCGELASGELNVGLDTGPSLNVDHVVLATGYKVDVYQVPYLTSTNIVRDLQMTEGYPTLDEAFQSSIPGLFFTGHLAIRDFGPLLGFVIGSPPAARIIVDRIKQRLSAGAKQTPGALPPS
jgi:cation diffusion facilitator CzcD-associated flavoprotein CzcO